MKTVILIVSLLFIASCFAAEENALLNDALETGDTSIQQRSVCGDTGRRCEEKDKCSCCHKWDACTCKKHKGCVCKRAGLWTRVKKITC
uniref:U29-Austrotoxin-Ht1c_1 n=1 Tax=Hickmania troglodytes TaxID=489260 RepID=A0A482ZAM3_9ARAC